MSPACREIAGTVGSAVSVFMCDERMFKFGLVSQAGLE